MEGFGAWPATVSAADAMFFKGEANPRTRGTGHFIYVLDTVPEWDRFVAVWDRASRTVPPLYKRVVRQGAGRLPTWEDDPDFDLSFHLRRMSVASPGTLRQVFDYAEADGMTPHDPGRPLWQVTLLEGLEGGQAAVLMKFHHAWVDGNASIQLALTTYDAERKADLAKSMPERPVPVRPASTADRVLRAPINAIDRGQSRLDGLGRFLRRLAADPSGTVGEGVDVVSSARRLLKPISASPSPILAERSPRSRFEVLDVSFPALKAATKAGGFTINDGYIAGVAGGLRRYHEHFGVSIEEIPMGVPISTRAADDTGLGNAASIAMLAAPIGIIDPVERMQRVHDVIGAARHEPAMDALAGLANVLVHLPDSLMESRLRDLVKIDIAASQVRGLLDPTYLAGAQIMRSYGFGPKTGLAAFIGMVSHLDQCCITIHADPASVTDPELLVRCLRESFDEILALGKPRRRTSRRTAES